MGVVYNVGWQHDKHSKFQHLLIWFLEIIQLYSRTFFNYITGEGGGWNLEGMFDIVVTEICLVNLMSCP